MEPSKRKEQLIYGLSRTKATEVHVCYEQVCDVLGQPRTLELAESEPGQLKEALRRKNKRSLIPEHKRVRKSGMILFNRLVLLKELQEHGKTQPATRPTRPRPSFDGEQKATD